MQINLLQIFLGGLTASIAWFVIGGLVYRNPFVSKIYKELETAPGLRKWNNTKAYLKWMYFLVLIQCLLFALVYSLIKTSLPGSLAGNALLFGFMLTIVKIIPRWLDMWIQTTYPNKLLMVEVINGIIGSLVMAFMFALII